MRSQPKRIEAFLFAFALALVLALGLGQAALAIEVATPPSKSVPCAVVDRFGGDVQLLDASRNRLLDPEVGAGIPCDGWVAVGAGWVRLKHREGFEIQAAADSFFQMTESSRDGKNLGEQVVLFKGQIHARVGGGMGELRVLTANARARLKRANAIVAFSQVNEESELLALLGEATLENRFEPQRKILVKSGEGTGLNFKALRVVPSTPKAVSVAAVRTRLTELHVEGEQATEALRATFERVDRRFASVMAEDSFSQKYDSEKPAEELGARKPASVSTEGEGAKTGKRHYARHAPRPEDPNLKDRWVKRIVAGEEAGEKMLFPDKYYGRTQSIQVHVQDPLAGDTRRRNQEEEQEKARLIRELSQIRPE